MIDPFRPCIVSFSSLTEQKFTEGLCVSDSQAFEMHH